MMNHLPMKRRTQQRNIILSTLTKAARPLGPREVLDLAQRELPRLGIATVYRALNALTADGTLRSVQLPGHTARYELADLDHHHHFYCTRCERVYDLSGCALAPAYDPPAGFTVESHDITLSGCCADCRQAG